MGLDNRDGSRLKIGEKTGMRVVGQKGCAQQRLHARVAGERTRLG